MWFEVKRSTKNGKPLLIVHYEENTNFWKQDMTECPSFPELKDRLEFTLMVSHWWENHHHEFEEKWQWIKRLDVFKSYFPDKYKQT